MTKCRNRRVLPERARTLAICIALTSVVAVQSACTPDSGRNATASAQQPSPKKLSIGELKSGTRLAMNGGIARGAEKTVFSTDETIHVAMRLHDAPKGTIVKVLWKAPGGETLGEEAKRLQPGQEYMYFSADGASLPKGTGYHAEISANGEPVTVLRFDLTNGG